jgi:hypothetical protein
MKTFVQIGIAVGKLVEEKNAAYGSSFAVAGDFLRLLFPAGIPPERFDDALLLVRIFDKQMRIATDKDAFGESPYQDIAGYGVLGVRLHQQKKENSPVCPGTASADAEPSSREQHASAVKPIAGTIRTNANATTENAPSQPQKSSFAPSQDASAATAMVPASASEVALRRRSTNNLSGACAACARTLSRIENLNHFVQVIEDLTFIYCSERCAIADKPEVTA